MIVSRALIASPNGQKIERLFLLDPRFFVMETLETGENLYSSLFTLCPDLLVLDGVIEGQDSLRLMDLLRTSVVTPPRILFLSRTEAETASAIQKGADRTTLWPCEDEKIIALAHETASLPLPLLAKDTEDIRYAFADEKLSALHMPSNLKGRKYIQAATAMAACAPTLLLSLKFSLYPLLSSHYSVSPAAIERSIRTAIEATWLSGDLKAIHQLFGFSVDAEKGKPTNSEFLSMLAEHVRQKTRYALLYQAE